MARLSAAFRASALLLAIGLLWPPSAVAQAPSVRIVAIGASNTSGWGVGEENAYPARLEALLRAKGVAARVVNAGVPFDTTGAMLRRLDDAVPEGTTLVILHPGANDLRFFGTRERRAANIAAMAQRLQTRRIKVVIYDDIVPARYYSWDGIHFTREGHAMIAAALLPQVLRELSARARREARN
jgi:acyl-CoA thioesterase I